MVGLLSGMDDEHRSSVAQDEKDVDAGAAKEESTAQTSPADGSQPAAENTDNVDEVEDVKELKSILKRRGQYTFRKVHVDFDLIPTKIPYDEDDYTVEIKIIDKEPVKIKSWAAIFAAKKAEAEAEAAAIAEAEEALKKAEEVQKREALKKANKAKLKKLGDQSALSNATVASSPTEQNEQVSSSCDNSPQEQTSTVGSTFERIEPDSIHESVDEGTTREPDEHQEPLAESNYSKETSEMEETSQSEKTCEPTYQSAEYIVNELLDTAIIPDDLLRKDSLQSKEVELNSDQKDEESSCTESLVAERSEHLQEEHTNDDLEDISTQEEVSVSQLSEDSNTKGSLSQDIQSNVSYNRSSLEEKSSDEDASASHSQESAPKSSHSDASVSHSQDSPPKSSHSDASVSHSQDSPPKSSHSDASVSHSQDSPPKSSHSDASVSHSQESAPKSCHSDASVSHSQESPSKSSHSEDTSSKLVELGGKQVPKKVLVTAASIVEEILSEMPELGPSKLKDHGSSKEFIPMSKENNETQKHLQNDAKPGLVDSNLANDLNNKSRNVTLESGARRKRREFKKSNDSKIFEHVKRSLENAAPEILETAVGVLEEIEKIVVEKVGSAIL